MSVTAINILGVIGVVCGGFLVVWFITTRLKKAADAGEMIVRWGITIAALAFWIFLGLKTKRSDPFTTFLYVGVAAGSALIVAVFWAPRIGEILSSPFTRLYDGGDTEPDPRPMYSIAIGHRKRGNYQKAVAEVKRQLAMFPEDFEGLMLLADIQFKDLKSLPSALETIEYILSPELAAKNAAFALSTVGDWHLELGDRESARCAFEQIIERLPDTEQAQIAAQRLAHLASPEQLADKRDRRVIALPHSDERIGLRGETITAPPPESATVIAQRYLDHLMDHPLDNEVREKLAVVYATEFQRLDLAGAEIEQLIATPNQMPKNIAHWLNLLADFQIRLGNDAELARQTLQRILDLYPNSAAANNARVRMSQLRLELNHNTTQRTVKLGNYEQNIGLKRMNSSGGNEEKS